MEFQDIAELKQQLSGEVVTKEDEQYAKASKTFVTQGTPALIAYPKTSQEVSLVVEFAKKHKMILSICSGGHSVGGFSTNDGGVVLNLEHFNTVEVLDTAKRTVKIGSGCVWGNVSKELHKHGWAISSGDTASVGVGGLSTAGGIGFMVRKYGLAIDNIVGAEIVTADGQIMHISQTEQPDLFWAIRGGGGNFGVVTYFEFKAAEVSNVYAGVIFYKLDNLFQSLTKWREIVRNSSEDLTTIFNIMPQFGDNPPGIMLLVCFNGGEAEGKAAVEPLLKIGTITHQDVKEKPYSEVLGEAHPMQGMKQIVRNVFVDDLTDEIIDQLAAVHKEHPGIIVQIRNLGGAMARVDADATAFAHRQSKYMILSPTFVPHESTDEQIQKALEPWNKIAKFGNGAYANFLSTCSEEDIKDIYPPKTLERLRIIKKEYDPENLFNQTFNIKP